MYEQLEVFPCVQNMGKETKIVAMVRGARGIARKISLKTPLLGCLILHTPPFNENRKDRDYKHSFRK